MITRYTEERHEFGCERPRPTDSVMQVIYKDGHPWAIDFACPCGCPYACFVSLATPAHPKRDREWNYSPGPILSPSFQRHTPCNSHFNIEAIDGIPGRVKWHGNPVLGA
jgi:hypothetical protein